MTILHLVKTILGNDIRFQEAMKFDSSDNPKRVANINNCIK